MILHDARLYGESELQTIRIENGIIASIGTIASLPLSDKRQIDLMGATVLPGFINSHDHLDFNCYPAFGDTIYSNYRDWGPAIQLKYASEIREVQSIPVDLRLKWGIYKNLLNGFTTVVNHGPRLPVKDDLISIFQRTESLHSPAFEKNWKWKLNNPFKKSLPVSIHVGEGADTSAEAEIEELIKANKIGRNIIAIHGVSMNEKQAGSFKGLVWCPASNFFLLGKTAAINQLKKNTRTVFGTDSTLTSHWNCWEHFRQALGTGMINEKELLEMLTLAPAELWKLNDRGKIETGKKADLLVIKEHANMFTLDPADILIVIHAGDIRLIDSSLGRQTRGFTEIVICGKTKYVQGDPGAFAKKIKNIYPRLNIPFET